MNINQPLTNNCLIELEILSGKTTHNELEKYKRAQQEYDREIRRLESMALSTDKLEIPEEPEITIEYRRQWFNFNGVHILFFHADWDEEREVQIITLDYYNTFTKEFDQINIKISETDWKNLLDRLNYTFIKIIK